MSCTYPCKQTASKTCLISKLQDHLARTLMHRTPIPPIDNRPPAAGGGGGGPWLWPIATEQRASAARSSPQPPAPRPRPGRPPAAAHAHRPPPRRPPPTAHHHHHHHHHHWPLATTTGHHHHPPRTAYHAPCPLVGSAAKSGATLRVCGLLLFSAGGLFVSSSCLCMQPSFCWCLVANRDFISWFCTGPILVTGDSAGFFF
jgi:hypothetical protein